MIDFILTFLSLSLSGTLIALLLFSIKPIIKNRLSKTWQYYIFLIVIVRLLLPLGPDTNLMGLVFNQVVNDNVHENLNDEATTSHLTRLPSEIYKVEEAKKTNESIPLKKSIWEMWSSWLYLVWIIPAVLLCLRKVVNHHSYIQLVKRGNRCIKDVHLLTTYQEVCEGMGMKRVPNLMTNMHIASPMIIGLIRPVIVLPDIGLNDDAMHYVFQHELTHYRRLDIVYKWLVQMVLCIHWFNPAVYWINREIDRNCELSCDEVVLKRLDKKEQYAYGDMLLHAIQPGHMKQKKVLLTLSNDTKLIKERLKAIMTHKKSSRKVIVISTILTIGLLCCAVYAGSYKLTNKDSNTLTEPGSNKQITLGSQNNPTPFESMEYPIYIEEMKLQYYEAADPDDRWPYLHWIISNNADRTINDYEMACLAYDKDGNPLKLNWTYYGFGDEDDQRDFETNQDDRSYENVITSTKPILSGQKENLNGGWSLHDGWNKANKTHQVAYVLAYMKQITFDDHTIWENPEYQTWLSKYKGKRVSLDTLNTYYKAP